MYITIIIKKKQQQNTNISQKPIHLSPLTPTVSLPSLFSRRSGHFRRPSRPAKTLGAALLTDDPSQPRREAVCRESARNVWPGRVTMPRISGSPTIRSCPLDLPPAHLTHG